MVGDLDFRVSLPRLLHEQSGAFGPAKAGSVVNNFPRLAPEEITLPLGKPPTSQGGAGYLNWEMQNAECRMRRRGGAEDMQNVECRVQNFFCFEAHLLERGKLLSRGWE